MVDAGLGLSGADAAGREGFRQLAAEVAPGRAGLVMGLEASRLARSNALFRYRNKADCSAYGFMPRRAARPLAGAVSAAVGSA